MSKNKKQIEHLNGSKAPIARCPRYKTRSIILFEIVLDNTNNNSLSLNEFKINPMKEKNVIEDEFNTFHPVPHINSRTLFLPYERKAHTHTDIDTRTYLRRTP